VAGLYVMLFKNRTLLFADTTVNVDPSSEELAEIAILSAEMGEFFGMQPRVAMLSFSNFGNARHPLSSKSPGRWTSPAPANRTWPSRRDARRHRRGARDALQHVLPSIGLGVLQIILIFPNLDSGNIAYKLMDRTGGAKAVGPF